jgi:hypothetical protein
MTETHLLNKNVYVYTGSAWTPMTETHLLNKNVYGYNGTNWHESRIDQSTRAINTIEYEHHEVHAGSFFHLAYSVADVGALETPNDMMTLTWDTPSGAKLLHMIFTFVCTSGALVKFTEGGSGGGADPTGIITAHDANRSTDNTSIIINIEGSPAAGSVSHDATAVTGGTDLVSMYIGADGVGLTSVGGEGRATQEWVLKAETQYQLSLLEADNVPGLITMSWYEHTDKAA